jgi:hypothetical protein
MNLILSNTAKENQDIDWYGAITPTREEVLMSVNQHDFFLGGIAR